MVENSSGKHKGETTISRRDQKRFRYLLFEVAMSLVAKLIRAFYAMLAKGVNYDPKKMMGDIERPAVYLKRLNILGLHHFYTIIQLFMYILNGNCTF